MLGEKWELALRLCMGVLMALVFSSHAARAVNTEEEISAGTAAHAAVAGYRIGAGDVLSISVWKNPDLTRVVQVLPDGTISFPLIGQIAVADLTVAELTGILEDEIEAFSPDPMLSVEVQHVNSLMVYVIGRVNRPDRFMLNGNINVLQALSLAGGLTPFAKRSDIKILREEKEGTKVYVFDYDAVTRDNALGQNMQLQRGDIIVVP